LLEQARDYYLKFLAAGADDPQLRQDVIQAHLRMGKVLAEMGSREEARQAFEKAHDLAEEIARNAPADANKVRDLAEATWLIAAQQGMTGKVNDGAAKLHQARVALEALLKDNPNDRAAEELLVRVFHDLGELELFAARPAEAIRWLRAAYERAPEDGLLEAQCRNGIARAFGYEARNAEGLAEAEAGRERLSRMTIDAARKPAVDFERARLETLVGRFQERLDKLPAAAATYERVRGIMEPMARDNPAGSDIQLEYTAALANIGRVALQQGKVGEARLALREAVRRFDAVRAAGPTDINTTHSWVICRYELGMCEVAAGDVAAARKSWRAVLAEEPNLRQRFAENLDLANDIVRVWVALGNSEFQGHNPSAALAAYDAALTTVRELRRRNPRAPFYSQNLGATLYYRGAVLAAQEKLSEAEAVFTESLEVIDDLLQWSEKNPAAPGILVASLGARADVYTRTNRHAAALADLDRALRFVSPSEREPAGFLRASCLARLGRYKDATDEAERLVRGNSAAGLRFYNAACVFALCAANPDKTASEAAAVRALALLRQATEAGYADLQNIKKDPDLNALRGRLEFSTWITELEKKNPPMESPKPPLPRRDLHP
jgi:tetratricopeptide (TPR) repeat protein